MDTFFDLDTICTYERSRVFGLFSIVTRHIGIKFPRINMLILGCFGVGGTYKLPCVGGGCPMHGNSGKLRFGMREKYVSAEKKINKGGRFSIIPKANYKTKKKCAGGWFKSPP